MIQSFKLLIVVSIMLVSFAGCTEKQNESKRKEFFAWMDAYLAVDTDSDNAVAVTMYFKKAPYKPEDIADIAFQDLQDQIDIYGFQAGPMKLAGTDYNGYAITLSYNARSKGIFRTKGIRVTLKSNETIDYPVGDWTFDVGDPHAGKVNTASSPFASSKGERFEYQYARLDTNGIVTRIYYGDQQYIEDENGLALSGSIDLSGHYSSPVVYIKSKIVLSENGRPFLNYGQGSYCGAMNHSKDILERSKARNSI